MLQVHNPAIVSFDFVRSQVFACTTVNPSHEAISSASTQILSRWFRSVVSIQTLKFSALELVFGARNTETSFTAVLQQKQATTGTLRGKGQRTCGVSCKETAKFHMLSDPRE